jgi:large subunit ribosomal protein L18
MFKKIRNEKVRLRLRRKARVRKVVQGSTARPRLNVFRSNKHIYAQIIDDTTGTTLVHASSQMKEMAAELDGLSKREIAKKVGEALARQCAAKSISTVVFDRNGFPYWGRISAVADGAREGGLQF